MLYVCRLCHDEADPTHKIDRFATKTMECMLCGAVGPIGGTCSSCQSSVARYYCPHCRFLDDTPDKDIFHCDQCGICRVGKGNGALDFFHCQRCNMCVPRPAEDHKCVSTVGDCPLCLVEMFGSREPVALTRCGHPMHSSCLSQYLSHPTGPIPICPLCQKSLLADNSAVFAQIEAYLATEVSI